MAPIVSQSCIGTTAMDAGRAHEGPPAHELTHASFRRICDHILVRHHGRLRVELVRISKLLETVVRVHRAALPDLGELYDVFAALRSDLEAHLRLEENVLFPACVGLDGVTDIPVPSGHLLERLREDHRSADRAMKRIRGLCGDYDESCALCDTHRELFGSLHRFELDLQQHVHEENSVLFPRVLAAVSSRS